MALWLKGMTMYVVVMCDDVVEVCVHGDVVEVVDAVIAEMCDVALWLKGMALWMRCVTVWLRCVTVWLR